MMPAAVISTCALPRMGHGARATSCVHARPPLRLNQIWQQTGTRQQQPARQPLS